MIDLARAERYVKNHHIRRLAAMAAISIAMLWAALWLVDKVTPPQDNPFKPLDLTAPVGLATGMKLDAYAQRPEACFVALNKAAVAYTRVERAGKSRECNLINGLTLDKSLTPYSATLSMTCPLAAALHVWERHSVLPAAERYLRSEVVEIETFGSYSCRRVNGAKEGRWSEHARGDAVDISGFRLADGRHITVKADFRDPGPEGKFLRKVRDDACDLFSVTLSPDYNAIHADHLHLDMGLWTSCS